MPEALALADDERTAQRAVAPGARVLAVGVLATLLTLAAGALGLTMLGDVTDAQHWVTHTIEVQLQAERLRADLRGLGRATLDALASPRTLPVETSSWEERTKTDLARLEAQVPDNPAQTRRVEALASAIDIHIGYLRAMQSGDVAAQAIRRQRADEIETLLTAFGEEESQLMRQRQQRFADSARWQAVATVVLGILALLTLLATALLWRQVAEQRARADAAAQRSEALERARQRLEALARQLLAVEENERRALARELHDDLGQRLAALKMRVELAQAVPDKAAPVLGDAVGIADDCITQVRRRAISLRPARIDELGLEAVLRAHVKEQAEPVGVRAEVQVDLDDWRPAKAWSSHVFRIVQEAVRNAIVHGRPGRIGVSIRAAHGRCTLRVEDDGVGFRAGRENGMGLLNMRERCELLGGHFEIAAAEPRGTRVDCEWPMAPNSAGAEDDA